MSAGMHTVAVGRLRNVGLEENDTDCSSLPPALDVAFCDEKKSTHAFGVMGM